METILFNQLNVSEPIKKAIVDMGFEETTPIQTKAIPVMLEGKDVIAQAPTGTGKTCAFGIPAIEKVDINNDKVQVLILCPTRELVIQTAQELRALCKYVEGVRTLPIYGGQPIDRQIMALKKKPQIIIGTPGRVMDHLRRKTLRFQHLRMVVLDEADEMLNMGFREDIDIILESVPEEKQFVLFSATVPAAIRDIATKYQKEAERISVVHKQLTVPTVKQFYLEVRETGKVEVLSRLIDANHFKLSVVFCNTKKRVDEVCKALQARGYSSEALHGDMKQLQRDAVMSRFRNGLIDILIATDVAARGIDVDDVDAVFNYDIPSDEEYYVHRIGRTGRAKREGASYTFAAGREINKLKDIQRYTKSKIKLIKPPTIEDIRESKLSSILDEVKETIEKGKLTKYINAIEEMLDDTCDLQEETYPTSLEVAGAFLKLAMQKAVIGASSDVKVEDLGAERYSKDRIRLFINLGKKDNLNKRELIEWLSNKCDIPQKYINHLDMLDKFSFFEVPPQRVPDVLTSLENVKYKRRKVNVEVANKKK